jgi:nitrogen fixation/metabolism regulation signal transduction histidine kinase
MKVTAVFVARDVHRPWAGSSEQLTFITRSDDAGMSAEFLAQVFELLSNTQANATDRGLPIVKPIVDKHMCILRQ